MSNYRVAVRGTAHALYRIQNNTARGVSGEWDSYKECGMMARLARRFLGPVVLLVLLCASVSTVAAQGAATAVPTQGNSQFTGKVSKVSPFTVNSNGQDRVVNPGPNIAVTRDGKAAQLADLKVGDQVNVTANPDGTASRIEQTGGAVAFPSG